MHDTAYEIGQKFLEVYWTDQFSRILDVGSRDINGTLRDFCPPAADYIGLDLEPGAEVDVVVGLAAPFPFDDELFDNRGLDLVLGTPTKCSGSPSPRSAACSKPADMSTSMRLQTGFITLFLTTTGASIQNQDWH